MLSKWNWMLVIGLAIAPAHSGAVPTWTGRNAVDPAPVGLAPVVPTGAEWLHALELAEPPPAVREATVVRSRPATVDWGALTSTAKVAGDRISFPLFEDAQFVGVVSRVERRSASSSAWTGLLTDGDTGWFTIVVHDGVVAANVRSMSRGVFQIRHALPGIYSVREINERAFPPCGVGPAEDVMPPGDTRPQPAVVGGCVDDGSTIDVLVVYTAAARIAAGGTTAIESLINLAEAEGNSAYEFSQIAPRLRVVAKQEVDYEETGESLTDRQRLANPSDGYMDEVHVLRDAVYADVVSLFVFYLDVCGRASFAIQAGNTPYPQFAFNVVRLDCATGNYTFVHEIGHNQGCRHDRAADNSGLGAFPYAHGYRDPGETFRTVMAVFVEDIPRIPFFSNPDLTFNNVPLGVPIDQPNSAHNALTINHTAFNAANFRNRDCNHNGVCDSVDLESGTSQDCNGNGRPDECEQDCNGNGRHDACDIASGLSDDCAGNGVPDECEPDCNANDVPDTCDIANHTVTDNNHNEVPDVCEPPILYVDANATGLNTGTSWIHASPDLRGALETAAASLGAVREVWVATGTYKPDVPDGDRQETFALTDGLKLYGGFAGGETSIAQRNPSAFPTVLSGDLNGDDGPGWVNRTDNIYQVVTADSSVMSGLIDGFTITGGMADGSFPRNLGAGLFVSGATLRVVNCVFRDNRAGRETVLGYGGGAFHQTGAPAFVGCTFVGNVATGGGGAISGTGAIGIEIVSSRFLGNESMFGGAIRNGNLGTVNRVVNCLFSGNRASLRGGAIHNLASSSIELRQCTLAANFAQLGTGGLYQDAGAQAAMSNSILWGNTDASGASQAAQLSGGTIAANYVCVHGLVGNLGGANNIGTDPMLGDVDGADNAIGTIDDAPFPRSGSPCVDSGSNALVPIDTFDLDQDGNTTEALPLDAAGRTRVWDDELTANVTPSAPATVDRGALENVHDCNGNGATDDEEVIAGDSADCNANLRPDECEPNVDCNGNGVQDICDVALGAADCNANGALDSCELAQGAADCNGNGIPDDCDLMSDDCNHNLIPDGCDFDSGVSKDCNDSGVPDECESTADCDQDGKVDLCEIAAYPRLDCNLNGVIDKCESPGDCNGNQEPDVCDLARGDSADCDANGVPDECDLAAGLWEDDNYNLIPDPCEFPPIDAAAVGCRYLSVTLMPDTHPVAIHVRGEASEGSVGCWEAYVQADGTLGAEPVHRLPGEWGVAYIADTEVLPSTTYWVSADYGPPGSPNRTLPRALRTWRWADMDDSGGLDVDDILCMTNAVAGDFSQCALQAADIMGLNPNRAADVDDLLAFLAALEGSGYSGAGPCP